MKQDAGISGVDNIGVGVAAAIIDSEGRLLLLKRLRGSDVGSWGPPGGRVRVGETLVGALRREVREEIGVRILSFSALGIYEDIRTDMHWISALFRVDKVEGTPTNKLPTVHGELAWFSLGELPEAISPVARYLAKAVWGSVTHVR